MGTYVDNWLRQFGNSHDKNLIQQIGTLTRSGAKQATTSFLRYGDAISKMQILCEHMKSNFGVEYEVVDDIDKLGELAAYAAQQHGLSKAVYDSLTDETKATMYRKQHGLI